MAKATLADAVTLWAVVGDGNRPCARGLVSRRLLVLFHVHCECGKYDSGWCFRRRGAVRKWTDDHVGPRWRTAELRRGRPRRRPI